MITVQILQDTFHNTLGANQPQRFVPNPLRPHGAVVDPYLLPPSALPSTNSFATVSTTTIMCHSHATSEALESTVVAIPDDSSIVLLVPRHPKSFTMRMFVHDGPPKLIIDPTATTTPMKPTVHHAYVHDVPKKLITVPTDTTTLMKPTVHNIYEAIRKGESLLSTMHLSLPSSAVSINSLLNHTPTAHGGMTIHSLLNSPPTVSTHVQLASQISCKRCADDTCATPLRATLGDGGATASAKRLCLKF